MRSYATNVPRILVINMKEDTDVNVMSPRQASHAWTPLLQTSFADRRTEALGTHPSGATLTDRRSVVGDDAVNVVEVSNLKNELNISSHIK